MRRPAFTLIELLVVVAIIALLMSILLPGMKAAREQARDVVCRSNIGQVTRGFLYYAQDWADCLPGGTWDYIPSPTTYLDWLGIGTSHDVTRAPVRGTIFRYLNQKEVYRCPKHRIERETQGPSGQSLELRLSYTAPAMITGAPISMLRVARYPQNPPDAGTKPPRADAVNHMIPPLLYEEDSQWYLDASDDSAWSNWDEITTRHRGAGAIGCVDGHAELRKFPKSPMPLTAWHILYQRDDGRMFAAGHWGSTVRFTPTAWIRRANPDY